MDKRIKWIEAGLQTIGIAGFLFVGFRGREFIESIIEPIGIGLFVFISLVQITSFFTHHFKYPETRKSAFRKAFKWGFIIHHILILPSALMYFIPLFFTASFLILFYYILTIIELVKDETS